MTCKAKFKTCKENLMKKVDFLKNLKMKLSKKRKR